MFEMMLECLCSAMLPSCPEAEDPRIPIAVVKVRRGNCEIISVCNWTPLRRQLVTWPAMNYWFGWLPQFAVIREYIHLMCCEAFGLFDNVDKYGAKTSDAVSGEEGAVPKAAAASPEMTEARTMDTDHQGINAGTTFMARSLASVMAKRAGGMPVFEGGAGAVSDNDLMAVLAGPRGAQTTGPRLDAANRVFAGLVRPLREAAPVDAMTAPLGIPVTRRGRAEQQRPRRRDRRTPQDDRRSEQPDCGAGSRRIEAGRRRQAPAEIGRDSDVSLEPRSPDLFRRPDARRRGPDRRDRFRARSFAHRSPWSAFLGRACRLRGGRDRKRWRGAIFRNAGRCNRPLRTDARRRRTNGGARRPAVAACFRRLSGLAAFRCAGLARQSRDVRRLFGRQRSLCPAAGECRHRSRRQDFSQRIVPPAWSSQGPPKKTRAASC